MIAGSMRSRGQGVGSPHRFVCARCGQPRLTLGRKRLRWRGVPSWLCAECARALGADRAAAAA